MLFDNHEAVAVLILRVFLGVLFLFQGYDKVFKVKIAGVARVFEFSPGNRRVPKAFIMPMAAFTSWVEFLGGALLILGLFKYFALYLLGLDLILVAIGFGIITPVWDLRHVFPRLILIAALLLVPIEWDIFSLDHLFGHF